MVDRQEDLSRKARRKEAVVKTSIIQMKTVLLCVACIITMFLAHSFASTLFYPSQIKKPPTPQSRVAPTTRPNVSSYTPVDLGPAGAAISIYGTDFSSDHFVVKIGTHVLNITSRDTARIDATLPSYRMTGDLTVGYGNPSSTMVLKNGYRVYADPVIYKVQPTAFKKGDYVTITGSDLFGASMMSLPGIASAGGCIRIGNSQDGRQAKDYILVSDWNTSSDGTRLTFRVGDVFMHDADNAKYVILSPQPPSVTGRLRLMKRNQHIWTVIGPQVTWSLAGKEEVPGGP